MDMSGAMQPELGGASGLRGGPMLSMIAEEGELQQYTEDDFEDDEEDASAAEVVINQNTSALDEMQTEPTTFEAQWHVQDGRSGGDCADPVANDATAGERKQAEVFWVDAEASPAHASRRPPSGPSLKPHTPENKFMPAQPEAEQRLHHAEELTAADLEGLERAPAQKPWSAVPSEAAPPAPRRTRSPWDAPNMDLPAAKPPPPPPNTLSDTRRQTTNSPAPARKPKVYAPAGFGWDDSEAKAKAEAPLVKEGSYTQTLAKERERKKRLEVEAQVKAEADAKAKAAAKAKAEAKAAAEKAEKMAAKGRSAPGTAAPAPKQRAGPRPESAQRTKHLRWEETPEAKEVEALLAEPSARKQGGDALPFRAFERAVEMGSPNAQRLRDARVPKAWDAGTGEGTETDATSKLGAGRAQRCLDVDSAAGSRKLDAAPKKAGNVRVDGRAGGNIV
eukprot:gene18863-22536_t